jgi:hypothetical protein
MQLDDKIHVVYSRAIPLGNVQYNGVGICDISGYGYSMDLEIVQSEGVKNSISKKYYIPGGENSTNINGGSFWKRLLPISASGVGSYQGFNDLAVDAKVSYNVTTQSYQTQLAVVRSQVLMVGGLVDNANVNSGNIQCSLVVCQNKNNPVTINPWTAAYTSVIPDVSKLDNIYCGTLIGVKHYRDNGNVGGVIGVGTDTPDPGLLMDINGPIRCYGSIFTEKRFSSAAGESSFPDIKVTGNATIATANVTTLKCNSLDISNFSTLGNVKSGTGTSFTQAENTAFNFSDKIRIRYNSTADSLEIQRYNGTQWNTTAILAA